MSRYEKLPVAAGDRLQLVVSPGQPLVSVPGPQVLGANVGGDVPRAGENGRGIGSTGKPGACARDVEAGGGQAPEKPPAGDRAAAHSRHHCPKLAGPRASGQVDIERREGNSEQWSNWLPLVGALSPRFRAAANREEGGGIGALR